MLWVGFVVVMKNISNNLTRIAITYIYISISICTYIYWGRGEVSMRNVLGFLNIFPSKIVFLGESVSNFLGTNFSIWMGHMSHYSSKIRIRRELCIL